MAEIKFPPLPCFPCPHEASCCAYGTTLSEAEAREVLARFGRSHLYRLPDGEWRTRVRNGRCVFYVDGGCSIYDEPFYPAVCRGFPWTDAEHGGPYEADRTICGEFVARPELLAINPYTPPAKA
jgi:Fe-S-cluster containining protein